jgi:hypothetical protein
MGRGVLEVDTTCEINSLMFRGRERLSFSLCEQTPNVILQSNGLQSDGYSGTIETEDNPTRFTAIPTAVVYLPANDDSSGRVASGVTSCGILRFYRKTGVVHQNVAVRPRMLISAGEHPPTRGNFLHWRIAWEGEWYIPIFVGKITIHRSRRLLIEAFRADGFPVRTRKGTFRPPLRHTRACNATLP